MSFPEKIVLEAPGICKSFLHHWVWCQKKDENEERTTCYEGICDKSKGKDVMKVRGSSGKKVVVDNGDIVDQQQPEPIELDAEKAETNLRVKLKENGLGVDKSGKVVDAHCMETEDGSSLKIENMSFIASSQDIWPLHASEYDHRGYVPHLRACKFNSDLKTCVGTAAGHLLVLSDLFGVILNEISDQRKHRMALYALCTSVQEKVFSAQRTKERYTIDDGEIFELNQIEMMKNKLNLVEMLKNKLNPVELLRSVDAISPRIINRAQIRKDEQSIHKQMINCIKCGIPTMHIKDRYLTDIHGLTMTRKIAKNECICKQAELYTHKLLCMTNIPLVSYDINNILFDSPLIDGIFEISVTDFKSLYISALCEVAIDPVTIFNAWMKKMTFRRLNDTNCCLSKTSDFLCFKLKTVDTISHSLKRNTNIFSFDWKEISPENRQTLPDNLDFHSSLQQLSVKQCPRKQIAKQHCRPLDQIKPMCKPIYGTVDLKTGQDNPVIKLHETEKDSGDGKKQKANTDVVKEAILSNSFQQALPNYCTVFPVRKGQPEKLPKRSDSHTENINNRRNSDTEGFANGSGIEANGNLDGEGACAANTESYIQRIHTDHVSIDCHQSRSQSIQTDSRKKGLSMPLAENATCANSKPEKKSDCTNKTRDVSDQSKQHNIISTNKEPSKIGESGFESSKHNDNWQTNISRHPTSTDEGSACNFTDPPISQSDNHNFEPLMCIINKLSRGESVPPQVSMQYEMLRFCTLRSFPKENKPYITRLAQAGFYYAKNSDEVVCYCCAQRKKNWEEHDIPMDVHRQLNPNCKFLLQNSEVNAPIKTNESFVGILTSLQGASNMRSASGDATRENSQPEDASSISNTSETVALPSNNVSNHSTIGDIISNQHEVEREAFVSSLQQSSASNRYPHQHFVQASAPKPLDYDRRRQAASNKAFEPLNSGPGRPPTQSGGGDLGTPQTTLPKYPKYAIKTVRMSSFSDCGEIVISPESLVEAGFFYAGFGDCVRCFQCGVGLRHWSVEDDPWIEHSRWSKECSYVRKMRGQEFLNLVQMAVQYQNDQQNNDTTQSENVAGSNQGANGRDEVETLLHKNSAQSVLEMGYHPDLIRRAIRAVLEEKGREAVSASNLMEKIFKIEETPPESSVVQGEVLELRNQTINHTASSRLQSEPSTTLTERKESPRCTETTRGELQSATATANTGTCSHASLSVKLASAQSGSSNSKRVSRSSQLLEKKKLKEENEKLKQQSICTKCRKNEVCIVFLPCGHLVTCETCAPTVKYCTVQSCGKYIKGTVRTFLS